MKNSVSDHFGPQSRVSDFVGQVDLAMNAADQLITSEAYKILLRTPPHNWPTWKMGVQAPVYCNCRHLLSHPTARDVVLEGMIGQVQANFPEVEAIAGIANAGTPWAALVSERLGIPVFYVTDKPKAHGVGGRIHGDSKGLHEILLVDDLVASGGSVTAAKDAVENETDGSVIGLLSIVNWGLDEMRTRLDGISFCALTSYPYILLTAVKHGLISEEELPSLLNLYQDPKSWKPDVVTAKAPRATLNIA